jgi:hypothetical protein
MTSLTTIFIRAAIAATTYSCNKTNLMQNLSSVYSVTTSLHVLGLLVAHHREVAMSIRDNWYVLYVLVDCRWAWMESMSIDVQHVPTVTYIHCYLLMMATSKPETCRGIVTE